MDWKAWTDFYWKTFPPLADFSSISGGILSVVTFNFPRFIGLSYAPGEGPEEYSVRVADWVGQAHSSFRYHAAMPNCRTMKL